MALQNLKGPFHIVITLTFEWAISRSNAGVGKAKMTNGPCLFIYSTFDNNFEWSIYYLSHVKLEISMGH
jgi:hypothetical protein